MNCNHEPKCPTVIDTLHRYYEENYLRQKIIEEQAIEKELK